MRRDLGDIASQQRSDGVTLLVLFFGPSGVGKTTIMRDLNQKHGWHMIPTIMTRSLRPGEYEKRSVSALEFQSIAESNGFLCQNDLFGARYGTPVKEVAHAAQADNELWMLDFPLSRKEIFNNITHQSLIILPASRRQLEDQLKHAGRSERLDDALHDYEANYAHFLTVGIAKDVWAIINAPGEASRTAQLVNETARALMR